MDDPLLMRKFTGYDLLVMEEVSQVPVDDDMPSYRVKERVFVGNDYL